MKLVHDILFTSYVVTISVKKLFSNIIYQEICLAAEKNVLNAAYDL